MCLVPSESRRGQWSPRNQSCGRPWVVGTKSRPFGKSAGTLNHWAVFLVPYFYSIKQILLIYVFQVGEDWKTKPVTYSVLQPNSAEVNTCCLCSITEIGDRDAESQVPTLISLHLRTSLTPSNSYLSKVPIYLIQTDNGKSLKHIDARTKSP